MELRGIFFKSSQIRDFQEINIKLQISEDSELGGFTVVQIIQLSNLEKISALKSQSKIQVSLKHSKNSMEMST